MTRKKTFTPAIRPDAYLAMIIEDIGAFAAYYEIPIQEVLRTIRNSFHINPKKEKMNR